MPAGYYIEWSGEYENQQRARSRLLLVVPMVLIVIFALLYITITPRSKQPRTYGGAFRFNGWHLICFGS